MGSVAVAIVDPDFCMFDGLADEIVLVILGYLQTRDRWSLSRTCQRFQNLYREKKLWARIDLPYEIENFETIEYIFTSCINSKTNFLRIIGTSHGSQQGSRNSLLPSLFLRAINGKKRKPVQDEYVDLDDDDNEHTLAECFHQRKKRRRIETDESTTNNCMDDDRCTNLQALHLIRQKIDGRFLSLRQLPATLRVLNLTGTNISYATEEHAYFRDISFTLVNLEDLDMTDCTWVTSHALLALSKLPSLVRICLKGCRGVGNCIAYISLAMRLGFRKLKILDVTNTKFRGPDIDCASYLPRLEEFYVGEYDKFDPGVECYSLSMDINFGYFRESETLKVIDISGCVVSDNIFSTFKTLPNISKIIAHFTELSEHGIESFKRIKPACIVEKEDEVTEIENS